MLERYEETVTPLKKGAAQNNIANDQGSPDSQPVPRQAHPVYGDDLSGRPATIRLSVFGAA